MGNPEEGKSIETFRFQTLKWDLLQMAEKTFIYLSGITEENQSISVMVDDFLPYVYLELDPKIKWSSDKLQTLKNYLTQTMGNHKPCKYLFAKKQKIYYYQSAEFLKVHFTTFEKIKTLVRMLKKEVSIYGLGKIMLKVHEEKAAESVLQFITNKRLQPSGWMEVVGVREHFSRKDISVRASPDGLKPIKSNKVINPKVLSYDIECVSEDPSGNTFPSASNQNDVVICICFTFGRYHSSEGEKKVYSLVNSSGGRTCKPIDGATVINCPDEKSLLVKYFLLIKELNPDIITSYNGLTFDDNYLHIRAGIHMLSGGVRGLSTITGFPSGFTERKWNSSAYGEQKFQYIDIPGILHLDMLPIIFKSNPNLSSYKLDSIAEIFLNDHKVDLPANEMIKRYHSAPNEQTMTEIVTYCNQDTRLPFRLMQKFNSLIDLSEMSNVVYVPMADLITRGQQIRVFSQIYFKAFELGIICNSKWSDYNPTEAEKEFMGAAVQNPKCGFWENVLTFDFNSLYPTSIIAYNLCASTFIPSGVNVPEEQYNLLEWEDHSGCEHDHSVRKTKPTHILCKKHSYRFYKPEVKKGVVPMVLEGLLAARKAAKKEMESVKSKLEEAKNTPEYGDLKMLADILDKRQNNYKVSANSMYGGFGSDFSFMPLFEAAAATTAMGRRNIHKAIDLVVEKYPETVVVYGDTDSCFLHFPGLSLEDCFHRGEELEKAINTAFPKPMYMELEKIYGKYFLLCKKKYLGEIVNKAGKVIKEDKKGVVSKRRDGCAYRNRVYNELIKMVMKKESKSTIFRMLSERISTLIQGDVEVEDLVIVKGLKANYKNLNLPHVVVADKMKKRGKYVTPGTRVGYVFVETANHKDPQYVKAEEAEFLKTPKGATCKIDYFYYFEKQLITPIDEVLEVKFGLTGVLENLFQLLKRGKIDKVEDYFCPKFKVV